MRQAFVVDLHWTEDDWNKAVWSDEAKFTLKSASAGTRAVRKDGERYKERHIKSTHKSGLGSVMASGCFYAKVSALLWYNSINALIKFKF